MTQIEMFWKQRAKQFLLHSGEKNNKFFHAKASKKRRNNTIDNLMDEEGHRVDWENGLGEVMVDYFQGLFITSRHEVGADGR